MYIIEIRVSISEDTLESWDQSESDIEIVLTRGIDSIVQKYFSQNLVGFKREAEHWVEEGIIVIVSRVIGITLREGYSLKEVRQLFSDEITRLISSIGSLSASVLIEEVTSTNIPIRITEEPLTPQTLAILFTALTELTTKLWLIAKHRLADLIDYTQTRDVRFANEAGLTIAWVTYNSPFSFGLNFDLSATNVADGTMTIVDGLAQREAKREQLEIANKAALQKIEDDEQKSELERTKELLAIEREKVALLKETMEVQKLGIEYALEIADKVVDKIYPNADPETKGMLIRSLLPNILQLDNIKGLELVLPMSQSDEPETKENAGQ